MSAAEKYGETKFDPYVQASNLLHESRREIHFLPPVIENRNEFIRFSWSPILQDSKKPDPYVLTIAISGIGVIKIPRPSVRGTTGKLAGDDLLPRVTTLEKNGHIDTALDFLYDRMDFLLKTNQFRVVDNILESADVDSISVDILLGLLTASLPARYKLPARSKFFAKIEASIKKREKWEEGLLTGLES